MATGVGSFPDGGNRILSLIEADIPNFNAVRHQKVRISRHQILCNHDVDSDFTYFPIDVLVSMRCDISSGYTAEFGQIGCEGMVGINAVMGDAPMRSTAIALTSGSAYRIDAEVIRQAFEKSSAFRRAILGYMQGHMQEAAQRIVCNRHHALAQQFCRTLLLAADRLGSNQISLTHEQLAFAIGCRREAVSLVAAKLQSSGMIRYAYGRIEILDRARLEASSCECYEVIRQGFSQFLPPRSAT